ncbi:MAG: 16S rRNA (guanine(527)-N(7))-methyltransferase RsmG [Bacilli bacterium]
MDLFKTYYEFLVEENKKYNLTSITAEREVYIKHFEDSLAVAKVIDFSSIESMIDIGSGAGFPGIPLKMKYPSLKLTLVEPTTKKCVFLNQLVLKCGLKDVIIVNDRAENLCQLREQFDIASSRAVGSLSLLVELCIPLLKVGGHLIAMKGPDYQDDLKKATNAFNKLYASVEAIVPYELSEQMGTRTLIMIRKNAPTLITYPRTFAVIKKKPL